ncbi:hypothetical protein V500_02684 [Pseudogymnoascus sp. VKM F-4518 (FW-2643)]|nr:hypothetical protein V500_02684 [Pseudogymnoascus sp. VKM F-4518 (FW-2643)]
MGMRVWDRFSGAATQDEPARYNVEEELGGNLRGAGTFGGTAFVIGNVIYKQEMNEKIGQNKETGENTKTLDPANDTMILAERCNSKNAQ